MIAACAAIATWRPRSGLQLDSRGEEVVSLRENSLAVLCHCEELLVRLWVGGGGREKKDGRLALPFGRIDRGAFCRAAP